jgi:tRNA (adenine37-N6)-methyltransferase
MSPNIRKDRRSLPSLTAIGIIHTPFTEAPGTPIQSSGAGDVEGVVEVFPEFADGLRDIAGFDRLWLIYHLHRMTEAQLIVRPFLDNQARGVFATRAPARPNHLGLSAVRLLRIEENRLYVSQVDMLDGTPLLDIKPYVPEFDHFAVDRTGWYEGKKARGVVADGRFELIDDHDD